MSGMSASKRSGEVTGPIGRAVWLLLGVVLLGGCSAEIGGASLFGLIAGAALFFWAIAQQIEAAIRGEP